MHAIFQNYNQISLDSSDNVQEYTFETYTTKSSFQVKYYWFSANLYNM